MNEGKTEWENDLCKAKETGIRKKKTSEKNKRSKEDDFVLSSSLNGLCSPTHPFPYCYAYWKWRFHFRSPEIIVAASCEDVISFSFLFKSTPRTHLVLTFLGNIWKTVSERLLLPAMNGGCLYQCLRRESRFCVGSKIDWPAYVYQRPLWIRLNLKRIICCHSF